MLTQGTHARGWARPRWPAAPATRRTRAPVQPWRAPQTAAPQPRRAQPARRHRHPRGHRRDCPRAPCHARAHRRRPTARPPTRRRDPAVPRDGAALHPPARRRVHDDAHAHACTHSCTWADVRDARWRARTLACAHAHARPPEQTPWRVIDTTARPQTTDTHARTQARAHAHISTRTRKRTYAHMHVQTHHGHTHTLMHTPPSHRLTAGAAHAQQHVHHHH